MDTLPSYDDVVANEPKGSSMYGAAPVAPPVASFERRGSVGVPAPAANPLMIIREPAANQHTFARTPRRELSKAPTHAIGCGVIVFCIVMHVLMSWAAWASKSSAGGLVIGLVCTVCGELRGVLLVP